MQNMSSASFEANIGKDHMKSDNAKTFTRFMIFSIICLILSLTLPLIYVGGESAGFLSISLSLIAGAVIIYTSRSFLSVAVYAIGYLSVMSFTGSTVTPAVILSTVVLCGVYSSLVSEFAKPAMTVSVALVPILSFTASYALTGELLISLLPISALIPSAAMGITARCNGGRKAAISAFASASAAELTLSSAAYIYIKNGALNSGLIRSSADYLRSQFREILENAVIRAGNVPLEEEIAAEIELLSQELVNCLPGLLAITLLTAGYCAQKIQHSLFERAELEALQNRSGEQIRATVMSAIVFVIAHICSFTSGASDRGSVFSAAAMNISLILLPLMLSVGVGFLASLPHRIGFLAIVIWIGTVILSAVLSSSLISVFALIGSFFTIVMGVDAWAKEHYSKGEDQ